MTQISVWISQYVGLIYVRSRTNRRAYTNPKLQRIFYEGYIYRQGDSDVISSYHIYASCFRHFVGQALRSVCYSDVAF